MRRAIVVAALAAAWALGLSGAAVAQEAGEVVLKGTVVHGAGLGPGSGSEGFDPTELLVSLDVLEGVSPIAQLSTLPPASGTFAF